jgi:peptide/nickel transport system ATP-binding protein
MEMMLLRVEGLSVEYRTPAGPIRAADNVSFDLNEGETIGLAGESGCGKTTVALSLMRLLPRNGRIVAGKIILNGIDVLSVDDRTLNNDVRWKEVSIVFQGAMNSLNPVMRIGDQIAEAIVKHERRGKKESWEIARQMLELVGIAPDRIRGYPHELSGGQKQRVVIAMALVTRPKLIIADEPTTALDVIVQAQILELLRRLREKLGLTMILISHDLSVIALSCTRLAMMYAGRIAEIGPIRPVFKDSAHPYTQILLRTLPTVRGERKGLRQITGTPPSLMNPPAGCRFHPRCPFRTDKCVKEEPPSVPVGEGHYAVCHYAGQVKVQ